MAIANRIIQPVYTYYQDTTTNQSFMDMHYFLKAKGIQNNKFFLTIYDPDLMGVDPRDPKLPPQMKIKILRECMVNFWYFIREIVRIPVEGGEVGSGSRYKLSRGNLAMNYLFVYNFDQFVELPRQHGKTVSALCWYLWVFNFGTSNTRMMFINKKHDDAKRNLKQMKAIRASLPIYLQMDAPVDRMGKKIKVPNTAETLQHPSNLNIVQTLPAARTKQQADGAGRGCTMAIQYYDEFAFMPYNETIYMAAAPAYSRAKANAKMNHVPYGMLITTTPGDMTTEEGKFANRMRLDATQWKEEYYDNSYQQMLDLRESNTNSNFFHVRYTYQELGSGEQYFTDMVKQMGKNWPAIRREVLLEWFDMSDDCPFEQTDLDIIKSYCMQEPTRTLFFGKAKQYQLNIWYTPNMSNPQFPPIIGVDVSGALRDDSSAITIIDSKTTKVMATLNCNYITSQDLAQVVFDIVTNFMPDAIVAVEANSIGASVLQLLVNSKIKKNLYYEIVDKDLQERTMDGMSTYRHRAKVKRFGVFENKETRKWLIEDILFMRVKSHRDKFLSPLLHQELTTMRVKKNGKIEHADDAHDDQLFSYLTALYVWYKADARFLLEHFHMRKTELKTDEDIVDNQFSLEERYGGLEDTSRVFEPISEETAIIDKRTIDVLGRKSYSPEEFRTKQMEEDNKALQNLLSNKATRQAVADAYHLDVAQIDDQYGQSVDITDDALSVFYGNDEEENQYNNPNTRTRGNMARIFDKL